MNYVQPNMRPQDGTLDANHFQTKPFLDDFTKSHPDAKSEKVKDPKALANGATVALSNGLITLKSNKTVGISEKDVAPTRRTSTWTPPSSTATSPSKYDGSVLPSY
jgi:ABC-type metal ion transport system substrate-binding protein